MTTYLGPLVVGNEPDGRVSVIGSSAHTGAASYRPDRGQHSPALCTSRMVPVYAVSLWRSTTQHMSNEKHTLRSHRNLSLVDRSIRIDGDVLS